MLQRAFIRSAEHSRFPYFLVKKTESYLLGVLFSNIKLDKVELNDNRIFLHFSVSKY